MPKLILVSTDVLWDAEAKCPYPNIVEGLKQTVQMGMQIFLVSIHTEPTWLSKHFSGVTYCPCAAKDRKTGVIIDRLLESNKAKGLTHADIVVLGAKDEDFFMAVNRQTLFIRCDWAKTERDRAEGYGIPLADPLLIPRLVQLLEGKAPWYFQYVSADLSVYALTDAGTINLAYGPTLSLVNELRAYLKQGQVHRKAAFQVHLLSSLYATDVFREVDVWSCYPGSDSQNDGSEVMHEFCTLARTAFKKRTRGPLFIRHKASPQRHAQRNVSRTDPKSQVETVHLNPVYRGKLNGKIVAVLDDFLTYGVSFGVAAALLHNAGVKNVICVAMGKFGGQAKVYPIEIQGDPFKPAIGFSCVGYTDMSGKHATQAQTEFVNKFTKEG